MNGITGCPFHTSAAGAGFQPYYRPELHAAFEAMRRSEPVFWCEEIGYWVLTRHADAYEVLHDGVRFSSQNTTRPVTPMHPDAQKILQEGGYAPANLDALASRTNAFDGIVEPVVRLPEAGLDLSDLGAP